MHPIDTWQRNLTRRQLFQRVGMGVGGFALADLMARDLGASPSANQVSHFAPRAKSVIYFHLVGAPSHLDLFDYKPELQKRNGELCPAEMFEGKQLAFIRKRPSLLGTSKDSKFKFRHCGSSGIMMSDLLPNLQTCADEMCFVRSLRTDHFNHAPAQMFMQTGFERFGRPSLGAWANYGLGTPNSDLPGFVVMVTGQYPGAGNSAFGSGFLPSVYQGVEFRGSGDPVLFLSNPKGVGPKERRRVVEAVNKLNQRQLDDVGDPEIATRISQYEMAYRMQTSVPELKDLSREPKKVLEAYGAKVGGSGFANNCLLARRMVERGVRFVQLFDQGWDHHGGVFQNLPKKTKEVDQPIAALIKDLKQRGLLEETLVVWSAEFGRTPMAQGDRAQIGRDHHKEGFTVWMAGGGVKGGHVFGSTDELGYSAAENPVHVHDFNATILHLLGIDHEQLTYRFQGRKFRLTDVHGHVIRDLLA
ncbi:MAG: sulfatase [Opitutae bacterium]|nr:sulfatase [Opitutae bacterium]